MKDLGSGVLFNSSATYHMYTYIPNTEVSELFNRSTDHIPNIDLFCSIDEHTTYQTLMYFFQ